MLPSSVAVIRDRSVTSPLALNMSFNTLRSSCRATASFQTTPFLFDSGLLFSLSHCWFRMIFFGSLSNLINHSEEFFSSATQKDGVDAHVDCECSTYTPYCWATKDEASTWMVPRLNSAITNYSCSNICFAGYHRSLVVHVICRCSLILSCKACQDFIRLLVLLG